MRMKTLRSPRPVPTTAPINICVRPADIFQASSPPTYINMPTIMPLWVIIFTIAVAAFPHPPITGSGLSGIDATANHAGLMGRSTRDYGYLPAISTRVRTS